MAFFVENETMERKFSVLRIGLLYHVTFKFIKIGQIKIKSQLKLYNKLGFRINRRRKLHRIWQYSSFNCDSIQLCSDFVFSFYSKMFNRKSIALLICLHLAAGKPHVDSIDEDGELIFAHVVSDWKLNCFYLILILLICVLFLVTFCS